MRAKTLATTRPGEAIKDLEASLALAAQQSARIEQVRSATMLARMLEHTDKGEDARRMLGDILDTFPRSLKFRDLDQARRVLAAPGASSDEISGGRRACSLSAAQARPARCCAASTMSLASFRPTPVISHSA